MEDAPDRISRAGQINNTGKGVEPDCPEVSTSLNTPSDLTRTKPKSNEEIPSDLTGTNEGGRFRPLGWRDSTISLQTLRPTICTPYSNDISTPVLPDPASSSPPLRHPDNQAKETGSRSMILPLNAESIATIRSLRRPGDRLSLLRAEGASGSRWRDSVGSFYTAFDGDGGDGDRVGVDALEAEEVRGLEPGHYIEGDTERSGQNGRTWWQVLYDLTNDPGPARWILLLCGLTPVDAREISGGSEERGIPLEEINNNPPSPSAQP